MAQIDTDGGLAEISVKWKSDCTGYCYIALYLNDENIGEMSVKDAVEFMCDLSTAVLKCTQE